MDNKELKKVENEVVKKPFEYEFTLKHVMDYLEEFTDRTVYILAQDCGLGQIRVREGKIEEINRVYYKEADSESENWNFIVVLLDGDGTATEKRSFGKEDIGVTVFFSKKDAYAGMRSYYYGLMDKVKEMAEQEETIDKTEEVSE